MKSSSMKFFTKDWFFSKLSDDEMEKTVERYWSYIDSIFDQLPFTLKLLSKSVNLHDSIIQNVSEKTHKIHLEIFCGNLQSGYFILKLDYDGVSEGSKNLGSLEKFTEIFTSELSIEQGSGFVHRMLLSNGAEIEIEFANLKIQVCNQTSEDYKKIKEKRALSSIVEDKGQK